MAQVGVFVVVIQVKWKCFRTVVLFRIDAVRFYAFRDAAFPLKIVGISCGDGFNFLLQFHIISINIREHSASEDRRRGLLGGFVCFNKARKHAMPWSTANDAHIGSRAEGQGSLKLTAMKDKEHLIAVVGGVGATMVLDLLTVVLRRQQAHGTGSHIVGVWNVKDMASAIIIQYGPLDSTNPGSAGIPIEAFDADGSLGGRCNKIVETVGDAGSSSPVHQYVIGVRVKYCAMGNWRASVSTMRVDSCEVSSDSREERKSKPAVARSGAWRLAVGRSSLAMRGP